MLMYTGDEVAMKRGKSVKSIVLIVKHENVKEKDMKDILSSEANSTPWLHLFFRNNVFETAHVAGDKHEIDLQAGDVILALFVYRSCFFVYRVGYGEEYCQFLGFLKQALMGKPYTGNEGAKGQGFLETIKKFDKRMESLKEEAQFKKLHVNA